MSDKPEASQLLEGDFFTLFGLKPGYKIDAKGLEVAYQKLTMEFHPDFFATAPPEEKQEAEKTSALVNKGYQTLANPENRAAYLLGLLVKDQKLDTTHLPPGFLGEMFELAEEVEALENLTPEDQTTKAGALKNQVLTQLETVLVRREALFEQASFETVLNAVSTPATPPDIFQEIQSNLNCGKYLIRLKAKLEND